MYFELIFLVCVGGLLGKLIIDFLQSALYFYFQWGGRKREVSGELGYGITKMEMTLEGHSVHSSLPKLGLNHPRQKSKRILLKDFPAFFSDMIFKMSQGPSSP